MEVEPDQAEIEKLEERISVLRKVHIRVCIP